LAKHFAEPARRAAGPKAILAHTNLRVATISSLKKGDVGTKLTTVLAIMAALGLEFQLVKRGRSLESEDIF
jgi:HTH-type transcriptional regulator/antitoxin HipB